MNVGYRKKLALGIGFGLPALGILIPIMFAAKGHKTVMAIGGGIIGLVLAGPAIIVTGKILDKKGK